MGTVISVTFTLVQWIALILLVVISYELIRYAVVSFFRRRFLRSVMSFLRKNEVRFDQYKLTNKLIIKDQLLHDRDVAEEILEESRSKQIPYEEARETAEEYIDEIVPTFNLLSYYKFGFGIANFLLKFLYEVVIDEDGKDKIKQIPDDSLVIYVMNHRSNLDYIVVGYMLAENISVSYAVGEWARVFPLELIFKSFGAYFVRRNFRNPLYHTILKKYVQLISKNRVTQGIFLEGALSRDGKFRPPKTGLLDYILTASNDDTFPDNVVFVPVGVNYDWILEDKTLISEWREGKQTMTFKDHLASFVTVLLKTPYLIVVNLLRILTRRVKEHGYVSVKFGEPVSMDSLMEMDQYIEKSDYTERSDILKSTAEKLLDRIGEVVPITPVTLFSLALTQFQSDRIEKSKCIQEMHRLLDLLETKGAVLMRGEDYSSQEESQMRLEAESWFRKRELLEFERDLLKGDEVEKTLKIAVEILTRRKIIKVDQKQIRILPEKRSYLEYYANTIRHHLEQETSRVSE